MDKEYQQEKAQDTIKIGGTVFTVNQIFMSKQTKQEAWLTVITRAESLKTGR